MPPDPSRVAHKYAAKELRLEWPAMPRDILRWHEQQWQRGVQWGQKFLKDQPRGRDPVDQAIDRALADPRSADLYTFERKVLPPVLQLAGPPQYKRALELRGLANRKLRSPRDEGDKAFWTGARSMAEDLIEAWGMGSKLDSYRRDIRDVALEQWREMW